MVNRYDPKKVLDKVEMHKRPFGKYVEYSDIKPLVEAASALVAAWKRDDTQYDPYAIKLIECVELMDSVEKLEASRNED